MKSARSAEPELAEDELLSLVANNGGVALGKVRTAVRYWARYPEAIDAWIAAAQDAEIAAELAWRRERDLLAR